MSAISVPGPIVALVSAWMFVLGMFGLWILAIARASYWREQHELALQERRRLERRTLIARQMDEQARRRAAHYARLSEDSRQAQAERFVDWVDMERGSWS